jgi:hypothetical protein
MDIAGKQDAHALLLLGEPLGAHKNNLYFQELKRLPGEARKRPENTSGSSTGISGYVKLSQRSQAGCIGA